MSTLSFSFNTSLISESHRDEFVKKFFSLSLEYQELTSYFPSLTSTIPDASEIPPPSAFVPLSDDEEELDGGASQVSAAKPAKMAKGRSKRKMSDDSLDFEKSVNEMNHKELCKKYRDLRGRKHNPKYPYGGVPKPFSKTEDLRVEVLRIIESEVAAPAEIAETASEASSKKPRKRLTEEERAERRAKRLAALTATATATD